MAKERIERDLTPNELAEKVRSVLEQHAKARIASRRTGVDVCRVYDELEKKGIVDMSDEEFLAAALTWEPRVIKRGDGSLFSLEFDPAKLA